MKKPIVAALVLAALWGALRDTDPQPDIFTSMDELIEHLEASNKLGSVLQTGSPRH